MLFNVKRQRSLILAAFEVLVIFGELFYGSLFVLRILQAICTLYESTDVERFCFISEKKREKEKGIDGNFGMTNILAKGMNTKKSFRLNLKHK